MFLEAKCLVYLNMHVFVMGDNFPTFCFCPVVQSIVSLTSSLVVKMLTVLVSTISNSRVLFADTTATHIFQQK